MENKKRARLSFDLSNSVSFHIHAGGRESLLFLIERFSIQWDVRCALSPCQMPVNSSFFRGSNSVVTPVREMVGYNCEGREWVLNLLSLRYTYTPRL